MSKITVYCHQVNKVILLGLFIATTTMGCTPRKKVDTSGIQKEMLEREPRKITDAEILGQAQKVGAQIASKIQGAINAKLLPALDSGGVESAIPFCDLKAYPQVDSLQQHFQAVIRRASNKPANPNDVPDKIETELLAAYRNAKQNGLPAEDNVQTLDNEHILFSRPIFIGTSQCLSCHGEVGKGLSAETLAAIKKRFPAYEATGYQLGDLCGVWSIKLHKKEVVLSMY